MQKKIFKLLVPVALFIALFSCTQPQSDSDAVDHRSNNANLSSITISAGTLSPAFTSAITAYTVALPAEINAILVSGSQADPLATVSEEVALYSLNFGIPQIANITVTAEDTSTKNYSVTVSRGASTNANILSITPSRGFLVPSFDQTITEYTMNVPGAVDSISFNVQTVHSGSTISYTPGQFSLLQAGNNQILISVLAQDGVSNRTYTIVVNRSGDANSVYIGPLKYVSTGSYSAGTVVIDKPFYIGQYEITREQFLVLMGTDPTNPLYALGMTDPVNNTNHYQAIAFCNKLSIAEGLPPVYSVSGVDFNTLTFAAIPTSFSAAWESPTVSPTATGYRLPTVEEWRWAAMGADSNGITKAFAGSTGINNIGDYAVFGYSGTEVGRTTTNRTNPVGSKLPNELDLYDMSGNATEWVLVPNFDVGGNYTKQKAQCTVAYSYTGSGPYKAMQSYGIRVIRY